MFNLKKSFYIYVHWSHIKEIYVYFLRGESKISRKNKNIQVVTAGDELEKE
jgi:uncharacterized cupin superfamily protein